MLSPDMRSLPPHKLSRFAVGLAVVLCSLLSLRAGTATSVRGLYYTGVDNSYNTVSNGAQDSHWDVTYATTNGGSSTNTTYQGNTYVIGNNNNDSGWVDRTNARWIVPPNASNGYNLPGNGTTGANAASYIYTLAFTIVGTGSGIATNQVTITLTLAADDNAQVYINPSLNGDGSVNTSTSKLGGSLASAWNNTQVLTLQNFDNGVNADNARFVIGTNYLTIKVDNTNSVTGSSNATTLNASGLLVYQTGSATIISPNPVPEAGVWLPMVGALGLFLWQRRRRVEQASIA